MEDDVKLTPMFEQYLRIKADYPDALLFYRMGDFYELFFNDAEIAAKELQIALTSRSKVPGHEVPMCGVPWHASNAYIAQLIDKGYVVAICEQTEDPKQAKGLVRREVTQVITPGTIVDFTNLPQDGHNYLGCLQQSEGGPTAFVWADVSTAHWTGAEFHKMEDLWQWVLKMAPRELLLPQEVTLPKHAFFEHVHTVRIDNTMQTAKVRDILLSAQHVRDLESLGLEKKPLLARACAELIRYLEKTQQTAVDQLEPFVPLNLSRRMLIDDTSERNLELFVCQNGQKGKGTLRHVLAQTVTPMGARLLDDMLHHPWRELSPILAVQERVAFLAANDRLRLALRSSLASMHDIERLSQKIALNRSSPKDLAALAHSLSRLPDVYAVLLECQKETAVFSDITAQFDQLADIAQELAKALVADPPQLITEGGLFLPGYDERLDGLLDLVEHGEQKLEELLTKEREESGLPKLKLGYNRVFGYYYEVPRLQADSIPPHFVRRQSLANAERFTTESLKELEQHLLSASEERKSREYELFLALRATIAGVRERLTAQAERLAELDYWQCLAHVGRTHGWTIPSFSEAPILRVKGGRHPVVEAIIGQTNFVPNDLTLGEGRSFCLLTGPNMSGKSTVLRQAALLTILAQIGSMVPAESAELGLVDKVFSRVGASDNIAQGESTFMVEMMETARILRQATKNSLIILDEIGRGTSTYDGVALAWAIVEYIVRRFDGKTRTLFATHYHELTELEGRLPVVFTMNVAIKEYNGTIVFLHTLIPGPADKSYGVEVARLAGIPKDVVLRARELLQHFESGRKGMQETVQQAAQNLLPGLILPKAASEKSADREKTHPLVEALTSLDPEHISPMEALTLLIDWKRRYGTKSNSEADRP